MRIRLRLARPHTPILLHTTRSVTPLLLHTNESTEHKSMAADLHHWPFLVHPSSQLLYELWEASGETYAPGYVDAFTTWSRENAPPVSALPTPASRRWLSRTALVALVCVAVAASAGYYHIAIRQRGLEEQVEGPGDEAPCALAHPVMSLAMGIPTHLYEAFALAWFVRLRKLKYARTDWSSDLLEHLGTEGNYTPNPTLSKRVDEARSLEAWAMTAAFRLQNFNTLLEEDEDSEKFLEQALAMLTAQEACLAATNAASRLWHCQFGAFTSRMSVYGGKADGTLFLHSATVARLHFETAVEYLLERLEILVEEAQEVLSSQAQNSRTATIKAKMLPMLHNTLVPDDFALVRDIAIRAFVIEYAVLGADAGFGALVALAPKVRDYVAEQAAQRLHYSHTAEDGEEASIEVHRREFDSHSRTNEQSPLDLVRAAKIDIKLWYDMVDLLASKTTPKAARLEIRFRSYRDFAHCYDGHEPRFSEPDPLNLMKGDTPQWPGIFHYATKVNNTQPCFNMMDQFSQLRGFPVDDEGMLGEREQKLSQDMTWCASDPLMWL